MQVLGQKVNDMTGLKYSMNLMVRHMHFQDVEEQV